MLELEIQREFENDEASLKTRAANTVKKAMDKATQILGEFFPKPPAQGCVKPYPRKTLGMMELRLTDLL